MNIPGSLTIAADIPQRSDEWYDQRRGIVTASAVGQLITIRHKGAAEYDCPSCDAPAGDPCRSKAKKDPAPIKTFHPERTDHATAMRDDTTRILEPANPDDARGYVALLAAERITGHTDPTIQSIDMMRGVDDEPYAIAAYCEHIADVEPCGFMRRTWDTPSGPVTLGYSPDGLVGDDGLVEVKSRRGKRQVETILAGEVPAENMAQLQAGLFVSGRAWIDYISYAGGMHLWTKRVTPDPDWFAAIAAAVEQCERNIAATVAAYERAVIGLPLTERPLEDMVI